MSLQRNIRPPVVDDRSDEEGNSYDDDSETSQRLGSSRVDGEDASDALSGSEDDTNEVEEEEDDMNDEDLKQRINNVSFGALLEAQEALSRKRKRGSQSTAEQEAKLEGIRSRLREIRSRKDAEPATSGSQSKKRKVASAEAFNAKSRRAQPDHDDEDDDENDSDSAPSEEGATTKSRSSKHAPASQSSKRQVTRKRTVIDVPKRTYRDPRFDAIHNSQTQPSHSEKAYGFLRDYQKDEIAELKSAIKKTRNEDDQAILRRKVVSMENRLKSKDAKDRAQEVLRQHRKDEREKVQQGKRPYFLKKSELKERTLVEKFKGMSSKDREKVMEKKKRKESQKEMKRMPNARRMAG